MGGRHLTFDTNKKPYLSAEHFRSFVHLLAICVILISASSYLLSDYFFYAQLFAHFQLQYAFLLIGIIILLFVARHIFLAGLSAIYVLLLFVYFLYPFELFPQRPAEVDMFFMNVYGKNQVDMEPILEEIQIHNPPVVAVVEANQDIIVPLTKIYGEPVISEKDGYMHCVVFTRQSVITTEAIQTLNSPACLVTFEAYSLLVVHTHSPLLPFVWQKNHEDIRGIGNIMEDLRQTDRSYIVVGDFNSSPYAYPFRRYIGKYVHKNVYTWETKRFQTLPLDYALSNEDITYHRTPLLTSDHAGLLIDLPDSMEK